MKKNEHQETERYIGGFDKEMKEKLEFVKTQSTFLKKVLAQLERQKEWSQFIIRSFERSAMMLQTKASPEEGVSEAREWPYLSQLKEAEQLLTQEEMRAICQSIAEDSSFDNCVISPEGVIIDFEDESITWHDLIFLLDESVIDFEVFSRDPLGSISQSFNRRVGDRIKATVYIHIKKENNLAEAFLKATGDDGKDYFFELSCFSMLFPLDRTRKDMEEYGCEDVKEEADGKDTKTNPAEIPDAGAVGAGSTDSTASAANGDSDADTEKGKVGMFILFSREYRMMFVTLY